MQFIPVLAILTLTFSCTLASNATYDLHWKAWKETHKKKYSAAQEQARYEIFILIYRFHLLIIEKFTF